MRMAGRMDFITYWRNLGYNPDYVFGLLYGRAGHGYINNGLEISKRRFLRWVRI
jgi:hypothetical protein